MAAPAEAMATSSPNRFAVPVTTNAWLAGLQVCFRSALAADGAHGYIGGGGFGAAVPRAPVGLERPRLPDGVSEAADVSGLGQGQARHAIVCGKARPQGSLGADAKPVARGADELCDIASWAWERGIVPRFIELMRVGEGARLPPEKLFGAREMREKLAPLLREEAGEVAPDRGPADGADDGCVRVDLSLIHI